VGNNNDGVGVADLYIQLYSPYGSENGNKISINQSGIAYVAELLQG